MKLFSKYLLKSIIRPFIITLILTNGILLIGYSFQSLELFFNYKPAFFLILKFLFSKIPENILLTLPISALVSILSLGTKIKGELVLLSCSGISKKHIIIPLSIFFLVLSIVSLIFSEFLISQSNKTHKIFKQRIKREEIKEKPISIKLKDGFVHIGGQEGNIIKDLKFQKETLVISAKICEYSQDKRWHLKGGVKRKIEKGEVIEEMPISILNIKFPNPSEIKTLSFSDYPLMKPSLIFKAILIAKAYGVEYKNYLKELHFKIAFPFSSLILAMIGLGIITRGLKFGLYGNIGIALLISFIYWEGILFFSSFPTSAILAGWAGNIIGGSIAIRLLF